MSDLTFGKPELYIEHHPDHSTEKDANGVPQVHELPGHVYFGIVVDGVKIPLGRKGTAGFEADVRRAKAQAEADAAAKKSAGSKS